MKTKKLIQLLEKVDPESEIILYVYEEKEKFIDVSEPFDVEVQPGYEHITRILGHHPLEEDIGPDLSNKVEDLINSLTNFYPDLYNQNGDRLEDWRIFLETLPEYDNKEDNERVKQYLEKITNLYKEMGYLK